MTPTFRNPEELRRFYIKEKIKPGVILNYYCDFISDPHNKFIVLVCIDPQIFGFFINSFQNDYHNLLDAYFKAKIPMHKNKYTFLDHGSFLDCSEFVKDITMDGIIRQVMDCKDNEEKIKGNVDTETIRGIIKRLNESEILEPIFIKYALNSINVKIYNSSN